jgi:SAM-dependent methyltransferase
MNDPVRGNIDPLTVEGFGEEWAAFDQTELGGAEYQSLFDSYFHLFPFGKVTAGEGFDLGCGSGRWAAGVAPRVGLLHCIDPSSKALDVARRRLAKAGNVRFHLATSETIPLPDDSQDFGYSLGVLHHIPDTQRALSDCVRKLKAGAPFLLYIYYALDGRPFWYRGMWRVSDSVRRLVARLPFGGKRAVAEAFAALVYWPMARTANVAERAGVNVSNFPLASYRHNSFYSMRTDALDRFGTRLEQRFTRAQIGEMMARTGLENIEFSERAPYWVALGYKRSGP